MLGMPIDEVVAQAMPGLRANAGVLVTARIDTPRALPASLEQGDVIRMVNGRPVTTPIELREALARIGESDAVVLQVERNGHLSFVACQED